MRRLQNGAQKLTSGLFLALMLSACATTPVSKVAPTQTAAPSPRAVRPVIAPPSAQSVALASYYTSIQRSLLTQGLLRKDGGGVDVPFTSTMLARNFERIALHQEYDTANGQLVARESASRLSRWEKPVRVSVHFGPATAAENQRKDRATLTKYTKRLARITGHPITNVSDNGNFRVYFLNEDERRAFAPELRRIVPGISAAGERAVINMPRDTYCLVFARDPDNSGRFNQAVAVIRSEHPDLMRAACIHEEVAQGLGLSNDSPLARPSIFNDDEEFGLLTTHDEMLLRILYDDRLRPGMSADEARPIITTIANELTGETT